MTVQLYDLEFERKILGACILRPELVMELDVSEQDFYSDSHRLVWQSIVWLQAEGEPVDTLHVRERLVRLNKLQAIGGDEYLLGLTDTIPAGVPPTKRLRELTRLRTLRESAQRVLKVIDEGDLEKAQAAAAEMQVWSSDAVDTQIAPALDYAVLVVQELSGESKRVLRVHPGLELFAAAVGDLPVGSMTVIGAQNNVGKSSIALEMCAAIARRGVTCGYCSFEDPRSLVGERVLSMFAGISARRLERRQVSREDWSRISGACNTLQEIGDRFLISTRVSGTQLDACAIITRMAQRGAKLVVVDYLQTIRFAGKTQDKKNEVTEVFSAIKAHCARLGVALVLLSQLSRPPKGHEAREPTKHDLKESGDIEDAAENIVVAWRTEQDDFAPVHLKYVKGKSGGLGQQWTMQRSRETGRLEEVT